ncbi:MAG: response regulator [Pseudolabrys sp.]
MNIAPAELASRLASTKVLVVDDDPGSRKLVRTMLTAIGVQKIHDAADGTAGLEAMCRIAPDVVILDWEMPGMKGPSFMRRVRAPQTFPYPDTPVIMLTGHGERAKVTEAVNVGVNEFLLKPVSSKALLERMISVLFMPRPMVIEPDYYGPARRKSAALMKANADDQSHYVMLT